MVANAAVEGLMLCVEADWYTCNDTSDSVLNMFQSVDVGFGNSKQQ